MNVFSFVSFVIAAALVYRLAVLYINRKQAAERSTNEMHEVMDRCRQLEERVRVLERIVTDKRADLEREFDEL